jgi:hypothetical protein
MRRPSEEWCQHGECSVSFVQTILLGAITGFTIYLGLPIGRIEKISDRVRAFLTM